MSSPNPYEYSGSGPVDQVVVDRYVYRSTETIAGWARWCGISAAIYDVVAVVLFFASDMYWGNDPDSIVIAHGWTNESLTLFNNVIYAMTFMSAILNLLGALLFCVWAYGSNRNAHALGAVGMEYTPGWTVGWNFIPIMNLFKPYQAIKETYKASDPLADHLNWKRSDTPGWFGVWWTLNIVSGILSYVQIRMSASEHTDMMNAARFFGFAAVTMSMIAAVLSFRLIGMLHQRLAEKHQRQISAVPGLQAGEPISFRDP